MKNEKPTLLIISYYFPPFWSTGTVRVSKMTKYLSRLGVPMTVITPKRLFMDPANRTQEDYDQYADVHRIPLALPDLYLASIRFAERLVKRIKPKPAVTPAKTGAQSNTHSFATVYRPRLRKRLERFFFPIDFYILWLPFACLYATVFLCRNRSIQSVWISGPPYSQMLAGVWLKKFFPKIHYAADFRDHWTEDINLVCPTSFHRSIEEWAERVILKNADYLIFVSEIHLARAREKGPYTAKSTVIYNGADPEDFPSDSSAPDFSKCTIDYFGNIGEARNIGYLLDAVHQLVQEKAIEPSRFLIRFYGTIPHYFHNQLEALGLSHVIQVLPSMPYKQAVQAMRQSFALLLVIDIDPFTSCYPTKFFEYIYAGRPIFVLGQERGAGLYVREKQLGWVVPEDNVAAIKEALRSVYEKFEKKDFLGYHINPNPFERPAQARQLVTLLNLLP